MSELEFLSLDQARVQGPFSPAYRSPLDRALLAAPPSVRDASRTGKLEIRGRLDAIDVGDVVRITPARALVLCEFEETAAVRAQLRRAAEHVFDVTAALAGLLLRGEQLMRRLTDLDLDALPAAGAVAGVPAIVLRDADEFRVFFPQEYGDHVARVAVDAAAGLP